MLGRIPCRTICTCTLLTMRTSRISKEASSLADALSSPRASRTRNSSGASISTSAPNANANANANRRQTRPPPTSTSSSTSTSSRGVANGNGNADSNSRGSSTVLARSVSATDIEDLVDPAPSPSSRKRKRDTSATTGPSGANSSKDNASSARASRSSRNSTVHTPEAKKKPSKRPSRKAGATASPDGSAALTEPPASWEEIYDIVKDMRLRNPTAPVDTVGCSELYWRASSPRDKRLHTLIALMLSSQTKDTVTAAAMQRLHTELGPDQDGAAKEEEHDDDVKKEVSEGVPIWDHTKQHHPSTLTLENILAVSPPRLNELINPVGFHNNKTKYIKAAALMLRDEFDSEVPSTPEDLMRLPGVGPKMAYLCMSAAWGQHVGIGVDVHVHRITNLWGWQQTKTPEGTRKALEAWLPREKWHEINKLLVGLGQTVCLPVGRKCGECDLAGKGLCRGEIKGQGKKVR